MDYKRKIDFAINLLRNIPTDSGPIEVCYSGGKDSDVILELAKMSGIEYEAIYKNTTIDRPGTIAHVKEVGATIIQPEIGMFGLIERVGWPSRWMRFCCSHLKEYKIKDRAIQGIRRSESTARAKRYKEPEYCRTYPNGEKERVYLPILEWTDEDVVRFIQERGIKCHPHYYDEDGNFQVKRRVGCVGCPLASDNGRADFKEYPKMLRLWARAFQKWWDEHPESRTRMHFPTIYHNLYFKFFCENMVDYNNKLSPSLFDEWAINPKQYLEDYFKIEL